VNAAVNDPRAARTRHAPHLIPAQCVAGVNADANNISRLDAFGHNLLKRFVNKNGIARGCGGCGCQDK